MAKGKKKVIENRISPNKEKLLQGRSMIIQHPLFSRLDAWFYYRKGSEIGKRSAAYVTSDGCVFLNEDYSQSPEQWAYTIAHCLLHLSFGHFEADHMPGIMEYGGNGVGKWRPRFDSYVWNMACDIYIDKFLEDIKFGKPMREIDFSAFQGLSDERRLYQSLMERGARSNEFGTMEQDQLDMRGLEEPIIDDGSWRSRRTFSRQFAHALAHSVADVVGEAGGHTAELERPLTASRKAAQWFVNHYPLLGGIASSFDIIEDFKLCNDEEISVAAICIESREIYVNPAAGLDEEELRFVMAHEFLHAGLNHRERCQGRDKELWNVACDFVINRWLVEMGVGRFPECGGLYDEELGDMSAESLYDELVKNLKHYKKYQTFRGYGKGDVMDAPIAGRRVEGAFGSAVSVDDYCRNALREGLEYHLQEGRGFVPAGLIQEIRALAMPPIPWDVKLANWFEEHFPSLEKARTYARPSRRQGATPEIPRPSYAPMDRLGNARTFGVVVDTSGSMSAKDIGHALGAIASYAIAREVPYARVVFCDAAAYDIGYIAPDDIAGRVEVKGRGGTVLQPAVDLLERAEDFPKDGPLLIITDGEIERELHVKREHAFLIPEGRRLPFRAKGAVFYYSRSATGG